MARKRTKNTHSRKINLSAAIKQSWGPEWSRPDVVYEFNNGRKFVSTDKTNSGVYSGN